jgi:Protein of unknown function (DUF2934)
MRGFAESRRNFLRGAGMAVGLRAYQLYEAGGREDGHELEDWFRAKEEITIKKVRTATA